MDALKDLSARTTLSEGGDDALADGKGFYRDILKNKTEAEQLEQEKREVKSDDVADRLIAEYEQRLLKEQRTSRRCARWLSSTPKGITIARSRIANASAPVKAQRTRLSTD